MFLKPLHFPPFRVFLTMQLEPPKEMLLRFFLTLTVVFIFSQFWPQVVVISPWGSRVGPSLGVCIRDMSIGA